jgi:hypothetical protein
MTRDTEEQRPGSRGLAATSRQFRTAAGLPERKDDKPTDPAKASETQLATEPEGGYGGKDGITNTGTTNSSEQARHELREEQREAAIAEAEAGEFPGETATEKAHVTGEDVVDVKPGSGAEAEAPAKGNSKTKGKS